MKIIVLAGGKGSRLWPFSKEGSPKQLLHFGDGESLLKKTLNRFIKKGFIDDIYISTSNDYAPLIKQHVREFAPSLENRVLVEPCSRGTAPAICWAIRHLLVTNKARRSDPILIVPSDHFFSDDFTFIELLESIDLKVLDDSIITFGAKAIRPETGFGYIKATEKEGAFYRVDSFIEKPEKSLAEKFSQNDDWLWNTGIYLVNIQMFLDELREHSPAMFHFMNVESHHEDYVFRSLSTMSIDNAVMEKSNKLKVAKIDDIEWLDVGSWDCIYEQLAKDENGNAKFGNVLDVDTQNCLIIGNKKVISTLGIEDLLIIDTDDAIFISKRNESQKVKEVIEKLNRNRIKTSKTS